MIDYKEDAELAGLAIAYTDRKYLHIGDSVLLHNRHNIGDVNEYIYEDSFPKYDVSSRSDKEKDINEQAYLDMKYNKNTKIQTVFYLSHLFYLESSIRVANLIKNPENYNSSYILPHKKWDNPIYTILNALKKPKIRPNKVIMGEDVWDSIRRNRNVQLSLQSDSYSTKLPSRNEVATLLEVDDLLVGSSHYMIGVKGEGPRIVDAYAGVLSAVYVSPMVETTWGCKDIKEDLTVYTGYSGDDVYIKLQEECNERVVNKDLGCLVTGILEN